MFNKKKERNQTEWKKEKNFQGKIRNFVWNI